MTVSLTAIWLGWRAPILAGGVTLATFAVARLLAVPALAAACGGAGLFAGWFALTFTLLATGGAASRLAMAALMAGVVQVVSPRTNLVAVLALAAALGWWFAGTPHDLLALRHALPVLGAVMLLVLLEARMLDGRTGWDAAGAGLALALALHLMHASHMWVLAAAVPAVTGVVVALLGVPQTLALTGGLAAVQAAVVLGAGRLAHGHLAAADLAAIGSVLAAALARRIEPRLPLGGQVAAAAAALVAALIGAGLAWLAAFAIRG